MKPSIFKYAGLHALGTVAYVGLVATFLSNAQVIFGPGPDKKTVLIPMAMLLLLIVSASVTGSLVFARPILWYLDGKKKEAVELVIATIGSLAVLTLVVFAIVASMAV